MKTIPIFLTIDESYAPYASVAIASLIDHASNEYNYNIHVIHENLTTGSKEKLESLSTQNAKIILSPMENSLNMITDRMGNRLRADYFTLTIYFRIFLPFMFPNYDKGIYIDSDVVLNDDISKLYNEDLGDNLIGAIPDASVVDNEPIASYMEKALGCDRNHYINSGVLLMNMKKLRDVNFENHFLHLLNKYNFECIAPDQDYINAMCLGKIKFLPFIWDTMPIPEKKPIDNPSLIHYNLFYKPWHYDNTDYEDYFWKYANTSLFKDNILKDKANFTEELKKDDDKHLELLIQNAIDFAKNEVTFKKVFDSGIEKRI